MALDMGVVYRDLSHFEGVLPFLYLDTHDPPLVTIAIGNLVRTEDDVVPLYFVAGNGREATELEKREAWRKVSVQRGGMKDSWYAQFTTIRMSPEAMQELMERRLENEFLPGLRQLFPGFDDYPFAAQRALIDISYNTGVAGIAKFSHLREACPKGDWKTASAACHVASSREERNDWRRDCFLIAGVNRVVG